MKKCELSIPGETRIALGVNEANRPHKYATAQAEMAALAGKHAVLAVLRLGKLLKDLKDATAHGEWGQLFKGRAGTNRNHGSDLLREWQTNICAVTRKRWRDWTQRNGPCSIWD